MNLEFGNVSEIVLTVEAQARPVDGSAIMGALLCSTISYGEVVGSDEFVVFFGMGR